MLLSRRRLVALGATGFGSAALANLFLPPDIGRAQTNGAVVTDTAEPWVQALIRAAESQIGVTVRYDGGYRRIGFPGGDVERASGVCTDVVIRAYRDMQRAFSAYPKAWGLTRPDSNIDHRRVLNLERFFLRLRADLPKPADPADYRPGDLATQRVGNSLPHIAIVADRLSADSKRPLVVHNIGAGTRVGDTLSVFPVVYRFRFNPRG